MGRRFRALFRDCFTEDTLQELQTLNTSISNSDQTSINKIKQRLTQIGSKKRDETELWPEFRQFLLLEEMQKLNDGPMKKIFALIHSRATFELDEEVKRILGKEGTKKLDQKLASMGRYDLYTELAQIIEEKPKIKEGLGVFWDKSPEFFKDKLMILSLGRGPQSGHVKEAYCNQNQWSFTLSDESD